MKRAIIFALIPLILLIGITPNSYSVECSDDRFLMDRPNDKEACVKGTSISVLELRDWELRLNLDCDTVDISNWMFPPNKLCALNNFENIVRYTETVSRGEGEVNEFGSNPKDISHLMVQWGDNENSFDEFLYRGHVDAFLVVQDNDIIFEEYWGMEQDGRHVIMSITKTTIPALIHEYINNGMIDPNKKVSEYIPEIGSGYADATVQQVLDMDVTNSFSENYFDPNAGVWEHEVAIGWRADPENKYPQGDKQFISETITSDDVTGTGVMQYKTTNTDVLAWIIEEVSGESYLKLFEEKIYSKIGAEQDAIFTVDSQGFPTAGGGLIMTARDLARYGQLWANDGVSFDGTQVIPKDWIEEHRTNSKGTEYSYYPNYRYHDQLWSNGNVLGHQGWGGQNMFADPETNVVVVILSSHADASGVHPYGPAAFHNLSEKISEYLSDN